MKRNFKKLINDIFVIINILRKIFELETIVILRENTEDQLIKIVTSNLE